MTLALSTSSTPTFSALSTPVPVLEQANEHLRSTVEDGLNVGRGYGGLIRYELDELLELDIRMQVNSGVPEGFSGLVEADFTLNSFDLDHDRLIYC